MNKFKMILAPELVKLFSDLVIRRGGSRTLWVRGRVCVSKGEALDRGTKCRAVGMGGGCPPPYVEEN